MAQASWDLVFILAMGAVLLFGMLLLWVTGDPASLLIGFILIMIAAAVYFLVRARPRSQT